MIEHVIYLDEYDWLIKAFYITSECDVVKILSELDSVDCEPDVFYKAAEMLENDELDSGLTYTDVQLHVTFVLISRCTSCAEFLNTFVHELGHVSSHLSEFYNIDPYSETMQYLSGDIARKLYKSAKLFLCEKCSDY